MTPEDWDLRIEYMRDTLQEAVTGLEESLGHEIITQKGLLRPVHVGGPHAIGVHRSGMPETTFTSGQGPIDVQMDMEIELLTKLVGGPEDLETAANRFSAAVYDVIQQMKSDKNYWWRLRFGPGNVTGRTATRQDHVLETISVRVWFQVAQ